MIHFLMLIFIAVFFSCTTQDGKDITGASPKSGGLILTSESKDIRTFIDNKEYLGSYPLQIPSLSEGVHTLKAFAPSKKLQGDSIVFSITEQRTLELSLVFSDSKQGLFKVNSNRVGSPVYINSLLWGKTPFQSQDLPSGSYTLDIRDGNYVLPSQKITIENNKGLDLSLTPQLQKYAFLEYFSNTSCTGCPAADSVSEDAMHTLNSPYALYISHHAYYPSPTDPINLFSPEDQEIRHDYYFPNALPANYLNGKALNANSITTLGKEIVDGSIAIWQEKAFYSLLFSDIKKDSHSLQGMLNIESLESKNLTLRIALIQKHISYTKPPGNNGQKSFTNIFRSFYPNANGQTIPLQKGKITSHPFQFDLSKLQNQDLFLVAYLQDDASKDVFQMNWTLP